MKIAPLLALVSVATALRAEPYFFKPPGWAIGTEFPAEPQVSEIRTSKPEGDIIKTQAVLEIDSEAFALTRIHNPVPIKKDRLAEAYEGAENGMLQATGAALLSEEKIEIMGRDSRRYIGTFNDGTMEFELRMVIVGDELFMFMYVHGRGKPRSSDAVTFFAQVSEKEVANPPAEPTRGSAPH